jgi:hypothetical protein
MNEEKSKNSLKILKFNTNCINKNSDFIKNSNNI